MEEMKRRREETTNMKMSEKEEMEEQMDSLYKDFMRMKMKQDYLENIYKEEIEKQYIQQNVMKEIIKSMDSKMNKILSYIENTEKREKDKMEEMKMRLNDLDEENKILREEIHSFENKTNKENRNDDYNYYS